MAGHFLIKKGVDALSIATAPRMDYDAWLVQQPFQSVDLLDPVVGSQRNEIHGN